MVEEDEEEVEDDEEEEEEVEVDEEGLTCIPLPEALIKASMVVVKSPPANFSFSVLRPGTTGMAIKCS